MINLRSAITSSLTWSHSISSKGPCFTTYLIPVSRVGTFGDFPPRKDSTPRCGRRLLRCGTSPDDRQLPLTRGIAPLTFGLMVEQIDQRAAELIDRPSGHHVDLAARYCLCQRGDPLSFGEPVCEFSSRARPA